jgi:hypothetical protein
MRIKRSGGHSFELELTESDRGYMSHVLRAAEWSGQPLCEEIMLLRSVLVGLRVVAADILGSAVLGSGADEPPPGDGNPSDA